MRKWLKKKVFSEFAVIIQIIVDHNHVFDYIQTLIYTKRLNEVQSLTLKYAQEYKLQKQGNQTHIRV